MATALLTVLITSADRVLFQGTAKSVVFPGEQGTFEVLPVHRPLVSRLVTGAMEINGQELAIRRGVMRVADDVVTAVVELPSG